MGWEEWGICLDSAHHFKDNHTLCKGCILCGEGGRAADTDRHTCVNSISYYRFVTIIVLIPILFLDPFHSIIINFEGGEDESNNLHRPTKKRVTSISPCCGSSSQRTVWTVWSSFTTSSHRTKAVPHRHRPTFEHAESAQIQSRQ